MRKGMAIMFNQFTNFFMPVFTSLRLLAQEPFFVPVVFCIVMFPLSLIIRFFKVGK